MSISAVIITLNEERNLPGAVESIREVCDEILVVDSGSTDRTAETAAALGARVLVQPYLGDGPQKDFGVPFARNDWILSLDADERLEPAAAACIRRLPLETTPHDAFAFRRKTFVGDRWIRLWYPDYVARLYDRRRCRYLPLAGHSRVNAKNVARLEADLLHYSYRDWGDMLRRADKFASRGAEILFRAGRRAGPLSPTLHGLGCFVRHYVLRAGFREGTAGLTVSLISALETYVKYQLLREKGRSGRKGAAGG